MSRSFTPRLGIDDIECEAPVQSTYLLACCASHNAGPMSHARRNWEHLVQCPAYTLPPVEIDGDEHAQFDDRETSIGIGPDLCDR